MTQPAIIVTRQQATREEIELAARLLLTGGSLICANLLAWAAIDVLRGIGEPKGIQNTDDIIMAYAIHPERRNGWFKLIKENYNFAKHSDREPNKVAEISREAVEFTVFRAIRDYRGVFNASSVFMLLFEGYYNVHNPDIYEAEDSEAVTVSRQLMGDAPTPETILKLYEDYLADVDEVLSAIPADKPFTVER